MSETRMHDVIVTKQTGLDNELTQSAHLRNPRLAIYATVGYTFLYLALILRKVATKTKLTFDPSIERHT